MADAVNRDFAMSFADLIGICNNIHNCILRDAAEFLTYAVNPAAITAFEAKINAFQALPTDTELASDMINATQSKNTIANDLRIMLRTFTTRAKLAFGENTGTYNRFYIKDISHLNDNDLLVFSQMVSRAAVELHTELALVGLTQAMIDDLDDKNLAFEDAIEAQGIAINDRDDASNDRIKKANELYGLLTRYCEIGKTIWYETNEARYNDYLIYTGSSPGSLEAPTGISFTLANMKVRWLPVVNATSYAAEISNDNGINYTEIYAGSENEFIFDGSYENNLKLRVRARNSGGFSGYSETYSFAYYSILPAPEGLAISLVSETTGLIRLNFEEVASATTYKIFRSVVGFGMPAGEFTYITEQPGTEYVGNTTAGMRNWFHVKAGNATQLSAASSAVFMDMAVVPE